MLSFTVIIHVSSVIRVIGLKKVSLPALGRSRAGHNKAGYDRNGGKGKRSDGKEANHCKRECVTRRDRIMSWVSRDSAA